MTAPRQAGASPPARSPAALRLYVQVIGAVGALAVVQSIAALPRAPHPLEWAAFAFLALATGSFTIRVASIEATMSASDTFVITSALLFGPAPATVALAVDSIVMSWRRGHGWTRLAFNAVAPALSLWMAARVFFLIAHVPPLSEGHASAGALIGPLFCLTSIYFGLNSGLTAIAVGLEAKQSPAAIWRRHFLWLSLGYLAAASVAFCVILLIQQMSLGAVAVILPVVAVFHLTLRASFGRLEDAHQHVVQVNRLYLSTVETLAMAIDAKDDVTHSHVRRVQAYAMGLARRLEMTDEAELKALEAAALLHDTGKLAVPEHILNKPGGLTAAEFDKMKLHVDIGADILSLVEFPFPVVPIVRCHHENWDGSGYPRGVAGQDIPLGARILSVVDCFDALTSDRPYRRRMTNDAALDILRERRGRMYDPRVVDAFIETHLDIAPAELDVPKQREVLERITRSRHATPSSEPVQSSPAAASDSVLAFVSLARLVSGDITLGDVIALSSNLILDIVPNASGAWYVPDAASDRLVVADAFGPEADTLRGSSVGMGERVTGWVAASRQMVVNSAAALDLGERAMLAHSPLSNCMSVPLIMGDSLAGVLTLYSSDQEPFDEQRGRLLQMIAPHIAVAIHTAVQASAAKETPLAGVKSPAAVRELRLVAAR